jgi:hypothetical protein
MKKLDIPVAFQSLPNRIAGSGIEIIVFENPLPLLDSKLLLQQHTLLIVLAGTVTLSCNSSEEILQKGEAIMMKKNCGLQLKPGEPKSSDIRLLLIFFDDPSLRYALLPFEMGNNSDKIDFFKIAQDHKLGIFTDSILLYYDPVKNESNWTMLLRNKLRELIWIFFHTSSRNQAQLFFNTSY